MLERIGKVYEFKTGCSVAECKYYTGIEYRYGWYVFYPNGLTREFNSYDDAAEHAKHYVPEAN